MEEMKSDSPNAYFEKGCGLAPKAAEGKANTETTQKGHKLKAPMPQCHRGFPFLER
jgi:hypothetical protein